MHGASPVATTNTRMVLTSPSHAEPSRPGSSEPRPASRPASSSATKAPAPEASKPASRPASSSSSASAAAPKPGPAKLASAPSSAKAEADKAAKGSPAPPGPAKPAADKAKAGEAWRRAVILGVPVCLLTALLHSPALCAVTLPRHTVCVEHAAVALRSHNSWITDVGAGAKPGPKEAPAGKAGKPAAAREGSARPGSGATVAEPGAAGPAKDARPSSSGRSASRPASGDATGVLPAKSVPSYCPQGDDCIKVHATACHLGCSLRKTLVNPETCQACWTGPCTGLAHSSRLHQWAVIR